MALDTKQQPPVILRLFLNKPIAIAMRNISALLLLLIGNWRCKETTQRGKECQSYFPQIFSISCPRSSPFPSTAPRARKSEQKSTEQGGERKKKTSESSLAKEEVEGKES